MANQVCLDRRIGKSAKKHEEVIDACEHLAKGDYGSPVNALLVMARQSPLFLQAMIEIRSLQARNSKAENTTGTEGS